MSDFGDSVDIGDIAVWITEGFEVNRSCVILDSRLELLKIMRVYKSSFDVVLR